MIFRSPSPLVVTISLFASCIGGIATSAVGKPQSYEELLLRDRAVEVSCNRSFSALPIEAKRSSGNAMIKSKLVPYKAALLKYDQSCFKQWRALKEQTQILVKQIFGILLIRYQGTDNISCAAFRLNQRIVLTAAHCLWNAGSKIDVSAITFRLLASPARKFPVSKLTYEPNVNSEDNLTDGGDYMLLSIDTSTVPFDEKISFANSIPFGEQILIPGVSLFDFWFRQGANINAWERSVHVNRSRSCFRVPMSVNYKKYCVITTCQTLEGMSGAPIIGYDKKSSRAFIGGVHIRSGEFSAEDGSENRECGQHRGLNIGIALPPVTLTGKNLTTQR
jgi:hypothetical protein